MSYTKQEFQSGEKLYASQLNTMDDQIAKNEEAAERLKEKTDKAILYTEQTLTEEQKAIARFNIGAMSKEEGDITVKDISFSYDGDIDSDKYPVWALTVDGNNNKLFVKVGDLPEGKLILTDGAVIGTNRENTYLDFSFEITNELLDTTYVRSGVEIPATSPNLTQICYNSIDGDASVKVVICSRVGYHDIVFGGWMSCIYFPEKGIYFVDMKYAGSSYYVSGFECSVSTTESAETAPTEYEGKEVQIFHRGLCVGDSITHGVFNHKDGWYVDYNYSYPTYFERMTGVNVVNAGVSGLTSKTWYEASLDSRTQNGTWVNNEWVWYVNPEVSPPDVASTELDYSGFDFAIIHLGINDVFTIGDDVTLETALADFNTYMNNIISKLKTTNKGIKIFLATIIPCYAVPENANYEAFNAKIKEIANATEEVYLVDLNTHSELLRDTPYVNEHLTAIGYWKMASEISSYISYIISKNEEDFKWVQLINTDYEV